MDLTYMLVVAFLFSARQTNADNKTVSNKMFDTLVNMSVHIESIEEKMDGCVAVEKKLNDINDKLEELFKVVLQLKDVYECGAPEIPHGQFEGNSTYFRSVIRISCNEGYSLFGASDVTCTADGVWTPLPTCKPDCESPLVVNSIQYDEKKYYSEGTRLTIQCNYGHVISGDWYLSCVEGAWTGWTRCRPINCGWPQRTDGGSLERPYSLTYDSNITLECFRNYLLVGSEFMHCNGDGTWEGAQECLERECVTTVAEDETNSTECLLKQPSSYYDDGEILGKVHSTDSHVCITYCIKNHDSFTYIQMLNGVCKCARKTGREHVYRRETRLYTYIRESELSFIIL